MCDEIVAANVAGVLRARVVHVILQKRHTTDPSLKVTL